ncbi:hypothetical protein FA95DRAFT_1614014 [Auriscalpium vulgare]|uniref:Uncharacterized protein n=1 Tax=Auriscalpium vulgare TaxID=40419 RepID=A0ACB8R0Z2_9AGAM|nr:hypothetical protein FA95DRAFT_1614014 [Auriscalpium vulgare]
MYSSSRKNRSTSSKVISYNAGLSLAASGSKTSLATIQKRKRRLEAERRADEHRLTKQIRHNLAEAGLELGGFDVSLDFSIPPLLDVPMDMDEHDHEDDWVDEDEGEDGEFRATTDEDRALYRAKLQAMITQALSPRLYGGKVRTKDHRTRTDRRRAVHDEWAAIAPKLLDAYLTWKYPQAQASSSSPDEPPDRRPNTFCVVVIGLHGYEPAREVIQRDGDEANVSLILDGLLGGSPFLPETAFSLPLLAFYHQLRRRHQVGIQGFMKVMCSTLSTSYYPALQEKFSQAFDAYVDLLESLQKLSDQGLGRDTEGWRLRNACPCCSFQIPGEPALTPSRLHAMDGCSSHKRLNGVGHSDQRVFESSYFQSPQQVDVFKDEVKPRKQRKRVEEIQDVEEDEEPSADMTEGLPTDVGGPTKCTDRWVTENATSTGKTAAVFEQTGIFIGACRHGIIELVQEMVRSGELAKYPLAMLDAYMREFGEGQCIGYDIGCSMDKTVQASSLKDRANELKLALIVNAFHGYAHNRLCQLCHHPLFRTGLGLEDFETCERIFSSLGTVARLIRHASHFHWKMYIHLHMQQWDEDRYAELCT